ncbi:MAG: prepilin-type N-terminal cleavage/methylation domain-containing protein [Deltaproteobacteria bacterium]|nr:MAG: prepilin-type N-terminal cleavage/methylation domain-containing protein [Deltaproteobacteria bacterium]
MNKAHENGFTLLEILVAISIFAIGLLAVASMQLSSIRVNAFAGDLTQATTVAQTKLEELVAIPYNDPADDTQIHPLLVDGTGINDGLAGLDDTGPADQTENVGIYQVFWNTAVDQPITDTMTIRVIVRWTDKGMQKRVVLDHIQA